MTEAAKLYPPDVFAAVATAMGEVKRIAKDNRNSEQKYDFASIDDFMAMVGPICAKNGLVTIADEESVEPFEKQGKFGVTQWARFTYVFTTYHVSGSHLPPRAPSRRGDPLWASSLRSGSPAGRRARGSDRS